MKRIFKWFFAVIGVAFIVMQFFGPAKTSPPVDEAKSIQANARLTPEVSAILTRSCQDCHSYQTRWPWYSHVAPVSWFLIDHVTEARKHLNFSEWAAYTPKRMRKKLEEMGEEVEAGAMPLKSYLLLHGDARLSPAEVQALMAWTAAERQRLAEADSLANK
jgi:hypothetical protein